MFSTRRLRKDISMDNRTYDIIKLTALVATPLIAFLAALCSIWNVPHAEQITATLTALDTLLGALVIVLSREYNKPGEMDISELEYIEDEEDE